MTNIWLTTPKGPLLVNLDLVIAYDFSGESTILTIVTGARIEVAEKLDDLKKHLKPITP